MKQPNYDKKLLKRRWQEKFFKLVSNKKVFFGLCGEYPKGYLRIIQNCGFKKINLFDINLYNLGKLKPILANMWLYNENINDNLQFIESFYDLDYCNCITTIQKDLPKIMIIKEFTMTIALRNKGGEEETLRILRQYNRNFLYRIYRESGTPMMITYFPLQIKTKL